MTVETPQPELSHVPPLPEELLASTTYLLKVLGFAVKEQAMAAYERNGVRPYHYAILLVLDEGSHETQGSIADTLGYDRGQLVGLLDELEEQNLVERRRDPSDRRRHLVRVTPEGKKTLRRLRTLARQIEDDFLAALTADQRASLHGLLLSLAEKHEPRCAGPLPAAG